MPGRASNALTRDFFACHAPPYNRSARDQAGAIFTFSQSMHGILTMNTFASTPDALDSAAASLAGMLSHFALLEPVFDAMPDIVFFVKDAQARYALVNRTLVSRCGFKEKEALLGKTAEDVFPSRFGRIYTAQDQAVIHVGNQMLDQLELHLYPGRQPGWCLTCKQPLRD